MKTKKIKNLNVRLASAVVGIALCLLIICSGSKYAILTLICVITGLMAYEFTYRTGLVKRKLKTVVSVIFSTAVPWLMYFTEKTENLIFFFFIFVCLLFFITIAEKENELIELFACVFGGAVLPSILSSLVYFLDAEFSTFLILLPFIASWSGDAFAHIFGSLFGKHKLLRHISPNKTVEGAVAALFGGIIGTEILAVILHFTNHKVNFILFGIIGLLGALFGMFGDLALSYIKRKCNIKDYGNLIPGHGGILDRFDSTMFVIPVVLFFSENTILIS